MTTGGRALAGLSWPDVPDRPLVLLPVGSLEQHGPHLPLDTDTVIASAVAEGMAAELGFCGVDVTVAPPIAYGASGEHQDFPGTTSVGTEGLVLMLVEVVRSLTSWADAVVLVNGHGGNVPALRRAVPQLTSEGRAVSWTTCSVSTGDAHAGHVETSVMLHLAADRVRPDRAVKGECAPVRLLLPRLVTDGVRSVSSSGVLGDPTTATAAAGARLLEEMVATAVGQIRRDRGSSVPGGASG